LKALVSRPKARGTDTYACSVHSLFVISPT
jgi:hypothetical protein